MRPLVVALVLAACSAGLGTAHAGTPPVSDVLPDIDQSPPPEGDLSLDKVGGQWRFSFGSEIVNSGTGSLQLRGSRPDTASPMQVTQVVDRSDASTRDEVIPTTLQFVSSPSHNHWHVVGLEHYELRSLADPGKIASDHKTGFCMGDMSPDNCGQADPSRLAVQEGIRPGQLDYYLPTVEGQYVTVDPASTPSGRYSLTHRSNVDHALLESNYDNNAASAEIQLTWANGVPSYKFLQSCPDSPVCGAPEQPQQDPPAGDPLPPADPASQPDSAPQSESFVPPLVTEQSALGTKVLMSRSVAIRLAREAIAATQKGSPRGLHLRCGRKGAARHACRGRWSLGGGRWDGSVEVWYRVSGRQIVWYYTLAASGDGKQVHVRRARGGSRAAGTAAAARLQLFCDARL